MILRCLLWRAGCRYRTDAADLPGRPDLVFSRAKVAIFCDGDFWHGKDWETRRAKLERGTNAEYWVAKIERNMARDRAATRALLDAGWTVLRFWESAIRREPEVVLRIALAELDARGHRRSRSEAGQP